MSGWWSLPRAAPALLKHVIAYLELAHQDFERWQTALRTRIIAGLVAGISALFALIFLCVAVVALTWDTPYRMTAIWSLVGLFVALTIIGGIYASNAASTSPKMFATVSKEWQADRVVLDEIVGGDHPVRTVERTAHASH